ncbi:MAG TPA: Asp23/Gls24 family envelope stress response protein [Thermoleophilia bacterium]|nr:Asp23/Gls24 family envelope stress response protein [Thermoleophilia bacterium]
MSDRPDNAYSSEVIASYVWDAIKQLPGLAELHRSPLQSLGERVHLDRLAPIRLEEREGRSILELHVVITPEARLPTLVPEIKRAALSYLHAMTGIEPDEIVVHVDDIAYEAPASS